jgi:hypothetical protein
LPPVLCSGKSGPETHCAALFLRGFPCPARFLLRFHVVRVGPHDFGCRFSSHSVSEPGTRQFDSSFGSRSWRKHDSLRRCQDFVSAFAERCVCFPFTSVTRFRSLRARTSTRFLHRSAPIFVYSARLQVSASTAVSPAKDFSCPVPVLLDSSLLPLLGIRSPIAFPARTQGCRKA